VFVIYNLYVLNKENNLLKNKVIYDPLTGLYSRLFFMSEFDILKAKADRNNTKLAILFIDLDGFKDINDSLGHEAGDLVLKEIAKRLKKTLRKEDIIARFGGDEFLIMLDDIKNIQNLENIANKILYTIKQPIMINNIENRVTGSVGISIYPDNGYSIQELIKYADTSMYKSKQAGKNRITLYKENMSKETDKRLKLKSDIYKALENNEFELFYQPQINRNNELVGIEVLIRWNHTEFGVVSPFYFIPLAIEIGFIIEIDLWVMENAIKQIKEWLDKGYKIGVVSCNLTVFQLEKGGLISKLKDIFDKYEVSPKYFGLEITEEGVMKNPEQNIKLLQQLKDLNITLSIDDFGTGYSSFAYLKKLPVDKLKIDRAFIKDIPQNEDDKVITSSIITLAKQLKLQTVAEGVETSAQKDFVFSHGCDAIQGYYYSPPIPAKEFEEKFLRLNS
jgi:diguanylate cyclase (GGDEF)-like protein